jgi:hypothetical protein
MIAMPTGQKMVDGARFAVLCCGMRALILCACLTSASVFAELTPEDKVNLLALTKDVVTEKVDEFEKKEVATYSGPEILLDDGCKVHALATWPENDMQQVVFLLSVTRVQPDWRWLKFSETKMLADGELIALKPYDLETEVFAGGKVYEAQYVELELEQVLRITAAETVKMRVGVDEWTWAAKHKIPLQVLLSRWMGRGGDTSAYKAMMKLILRPQKGLAFAEVVKRYGEPSQRNAESGWALWPGFWARFKDGKVIETRVYRDKKEAP